MNLQEFESKYLSRLNPQQRMAVEQTQGPILLLAVPGSGKTTVLVTRLGYMICCSEISPEDILTVTYTVAATRDMKARFVRLFGEAYAKGLTFRTINGICAVVVQRYAAWKGTQPYELMTEEKTLNGVVRELLVKQGIPFPGDQLIKEARTHITYCKNMMLNEAEIKAHQVDGMDFYTVYTGYQQYLSQNRKMDYDDQMIFAYRIFRQYPEILERFRQRYPYLCVDEAQDTSKIQHAILRLLAAPRNNIFMVGDEDQSIYGFRAAWPQALLEFSQTYPGARVLLLEHNYRSSRSIVERADAFIRRNSNRYAKNMVTHHPDGIPVKKLLLDDYANQYNYLLKIARDCTVPTAVLFRNNDSALPLINLLEREGVPYSCRQREGFFFTSPIVRDLTDMLEFAFDDSSREQFLRFYYKLDLKVKKTVISSILNQMKPGESVFDALLSGHGLEGWQIGKVKAMQTHFYKIPQLPAYAALQRLIRYLGYGDYLKEQHSDTSRLDVLLALAKQSPDVSAFLHRLRELREVVETQSPKPDCPFILSTIHASKGLEYDRVILMDVLDGLFPAVQSPEREHELDKEEKLQLEEERRLFYVAVTRARKQLELLGYREKFGEPFGVRSTFIAQFMGESIALPEKKQKVLFSPSPGLSTGQVSEMERFYLPGTKLKHKAFGFGILESRAGSIAVINFGSKGIKKLDLSTCLRQGIIKPE